MGSEKGQSDEKPVHPVTVDGFWMDQTEVTNEQFEKFVNETGYVTTAELRPDPKDFPGVPEENLVAGAIVFSPPTGVVSLENHYVWWRYEPGANWRQPEGPGSSIKGREKHPVGEDTNQRTIPRHSQPCRKARSRWVQTKLQELCP